MNNLTNSSVMPQKTFVQKIMDIREKYADILVAQDWNGLEILKDESSEEDYDKNVRVLWEKSK